MNRRRVPRCSSAPWPSTFTISDVADPTVLVDSKVAKLRASCDACNESKVRCSQAKPRCARCDRQGIACVYGLSRRSHKNAPRIGAAALLAPGHTPAPAPTTAFPGDLDCAAFLLPSPPVDASPEPALYVQQLAESADLPGALDPIEDVSMAGYDLLSHYLSLPSPDAASEGPAGEPAPEPGGCGCTARDEMIMNTDHQHPRRPRRRGLRDDAGARHAVSPLPLVLVGVERLVGLAAPRLSWGVLQIEPDEEDELKQNLWLL